MVEVSRVLVAVVVVAALSGCAPAASESASHVQREQPWPECGASIIYEPVSGFTIDTVEIEPGGSLSNPAC